MLLDRDRKGAGVSGDSETDEVRGDAENECGDEGDSPVES